MKASISGTDSLVLFRNSQGLEGRGTLLHLTRNQAVFEVYNPYSIVQLSEVLADLRILRGERTIYSGRAVASHLLPTGIMVIVSATLVDAWSDLAGAEPGQGVRDEVGAFVRNWEDTYALRPSFQLAVSTLRSFLGELSRWLGQVEAVSGPGDGAPELRREFAQEVEEPLVPKLAELFRRFEDEAAEVPPAEVDAHKGFARREIHPLMLCSPFVHRTYTKPLGYAGDYEMVNMLLADPLQGSTTYARVVNAIAIRSPTGEGHRNRIGILLDRLRGEAARVEAAGRAPLRV
ncbi:MAG: SAM-dependent methyltransferase, partial [Deferrisomatales bacterium]